MVKLSGRANREAGQRVEGELKGWADNPVGCVCILYMYEQCVVLYDGMLIWE